MRVVALVCNLASLAFTLLVVLTDGLSTESLYRLFTAALVIIPLVSFVVLLRERTNAAAVLITILLNVGSVAATCWALVDQYPHPAETGFLMYVVLTLATPALTILALLAAKPFTSRTGALGNA